MAGLAEGHDLPLLDHLSDRIRAGDQTMTPRQYLDFAGDYARLVGEAHESYGAAGLPDAPLNRQRLNRILLNARFNELERESS